jgi:hypothetical protein
MMENPVLMIPVIRILEIVFLQIPAMMENPVPMTLVILIRGNVFLPIITHPATMEIYVHPMTLAQEGFVYVDLKQTAMTRMPAPQITATP